MITLYYIQDKVRDHYAYPVNQMIYSDKKLLEDKMKKLSDGFKSLYENEKYEIRSIQADDKCKCFNYMQTTMILINVEDPDNIRIIGSDNYIGIHEKVGLSIDVDIESYTSGRYQLMSEEYFYNHYKIGVR